MPAVDPADVAAHAPAALLSALECAVPLWIAQIRRWAPEARIAQAGHDGDMIAVHGDDLQFGGKHCAETFTALARGLACAAYQPGGVSFAGLHWEAGK